MAVSTFIILIRRTPNPYAVSLVSAKRPSPLPPKAVNTAAPPPVPTPASIAMKEEMEYRISMPLSLLRSPQQPTTTLQDGSSINYTQQLSTAPFPSSHVSMSESVTPTRAPACYPPTSHLTPHLASLLVSSPMQLPYNLSAEYISSTIERQSAQPSTEWRAHNRADYTDDAAKREVYVAHGPLDIEGMNDARSIFSAAGRTNDVSDVAESAERRNMKCSNDTMMLGNSNGAITMSAAPAQHGEMKSTDNDTKSGADGFPNSIPVAAQNDDIEECEAEPVASVPKIAFDVDDIEEADSDVILINHPPSTAPAVCHADDDWAQAFLDDDDDWA
jgi:hypothetical protein